MNRWAKLMIGCLGLLIMLLLIVLAWFVGREQGRSSVQQGVGVTTAVTATAAEIAVSKAAILPTATSPAISASTCTPQVPSGWQATVNDSQGYTAYRPAGWYFRFFAPSKHMLGIDPNPVPDASEYAGVISLRKLANLAEYDAMKAGLEPGYSENKTVFGCRQWLLIEGSTPANEIFSRRFVKYALLEVDSKLFFAQLFTQTAGYDGHADEFNTFLNSLAF